MTAPPVWRLAWRNVRKNWRHSLAALLAIAAGFVAVGLFEGYITDLRDRYGDAYSATSMFGDLLVEHHGAQTAGRADPWAYVMTHDEQAFLEDYLARPEHGVTARVRVLELSGMITAGKTQTVFMGVGYDVAEGALVRGRWAWNVLAGKPLDKAFADEVGAGGPDPASPGGGGARSPHRLIEDAVVVGNGLSRILDCQARALIPSDVEDTAIRPADRPFTCKRVRVQLSTTTESGQLNAVEPEIVGITDVVMKELDLRYVAMPLPVAQRLADTHAVSRYIVKLRDARAAHAFSALLVAAARERGLTIDATPWQEHRVGELYRRGIEILGVFRTFVLIVVLIVAGMSVFNTMAKSVSERVREIGALRSLGFLRRQIVHLFVLEAGFLATLASVAGLAFTLPLIALVNHAGLSYKAGILAEPVPLTIALAPSVYLLSALFLAVVALVAAFLPARRAARMNIPDALGHV